MQYTQEQLSEILKKHKAWLDGAEGGERANLERANLEGANLYGCAGNRREIKSLFVSEMYAITYTDEYLQIGCKRFPIAEWWEFTEEQIREMDGDYALEFWSKWRDQIKAIIELSPAKPSKREEHQ